MQDTNVSCYRKIIGILKTVLRLVLLVLKVIRETLDLIS